MPAADTRATQIIAKFFFIILLFAQIQTKLGEDQSSALKILHIMPMTPSQGMVETINTQQFIHYARNHDLNIKQQLDKEDSQPQQSQCKLKLRQLINQTLKGNFTNSSPYLIYSGHDVNDLGMFTECINLPNSRYVVMCLSGGVPLAVNVILCVPQECTPWDDFQTLKVPVAQQINKAMMAVTPAGGQQPHVKPEQVNFFDSLVTVSYIQDKLNPLFIFFYLLTFIYLALVIGVSLYHYIQIRKFADEEPRLAQHDSGNNLYKSLSVGDHNDREPCAKKCMMSLSLISSFNQLFKRKRDGDEKDFEIFNFIRFAAMIWFILGNTFMYTLMQPLTNYLDVFDEVPKFVMLPITTSSLASDIFLLISGFLGTYILCRATLKSSSGMPLFLWTWIHRAIRIWPLYLAIFIWWEWIVPYFANGPMWFSYYTTIVQDCTTYWYLHVLFLNNLFPVDYQTRCMPWTYYIALDFQLQLLVPLFVWLFMKKNKLGYIAITIVYVIFLIISISVISHYHLSYSLMKRREFFYNKVYQMKPWTRCGPFFIGVIFAWAYFQHKYQTGQDGNMQRRLGGDNGASTGSSQDIERGCLQKFNTLLKEAKVVKVSVFMFGLFLQLLFALLIYNMNKYPSDWSQSADSFYLLFGKSFYILGVMFCAYPIMLNDKWMIRRLFSFAIWEPLSKLCFGAYLIAPLWCYFMAFGTWKGRFYSGWMTGLFFIGYIVLSFGIAVIASLFYEQPWARIEKLFCKTAKVRRSTEAEEEFLSKLQTGYGVGKKGARFNEMQLQEDV